MTIYSDSAYVVFQFTTSQGGRPVVKVVLKLMQDFQFTTSQGGRRVGFCSAGLPGALSIHDLTRRSTSGAYWCLLSVTSFNSRPHKEVDDKISERLSHVYALSIHDLTRRSTQHRAYPCGEQGLSIHDLTRRSTVFVLSQH